MLPKKEYFKGWYFKCVGEDGTVAFIPSFDSETAFLQIITDSETFCMSAGKLRYRENPLTVRTSGALFSEKGIKLDIKTDALTARGVLRFGKLSPIRYDIMGPFKLVPFMQCRHSVYSMSHRVDGRLLINGRQYRFRNGAGYIEGDSGVSFPSRYVWTQCCFSGGSLMLSAADIPMFLGSFTGVIGIVLLDGKEYRIATYLGAKVKRIGNDAVTVAQGGYTLTAELLSGNGLPLPAPVNGKMSRTIHESASCTARYRFSYGKNVLLDFTSDKASFEFEY